MLSNSKSKESYNEFEIKNELKNELSSSKKDENLSGEVIKEKLVNHSPISNQVKSPKSDN